MTNTDELNEFFKNIEYTRSYDIEKFIYSETINLDTYLFCSLNKRFNNYCLDWLKEKREIQTEFDLPRANVLPKTMLEPPEKVFPPFAPKLCKQYESSEESNRRALNAENLIKNDIVINHYSFNENQIEFEVDNFRLDGCYSIWYNILYSEVYRFQKIMHDLFKKIQPQQTTIAPTQQNENKKSDEVEYFPKPCFKAELIENITLELNTFFDPSQHFELKRIIETGSNTIEKLLFKDNGNRLTDYFKQLFERDVITGCTKKDLINWIVVNFKFTYRSSQKEFKYKTVESIISGNENPCKNPIV